MRLLWYLLIFTNIINFNKLKRTMENYQDQNQPQNYQNSNFNNGNGNFIATKLPNTTVSLVLGIVSIVCCCTGIIGIVCSIIGLMLANKDLKLYKSNPQQYTGVETVNTARILNIIGLVISVLNILYSIYAIIQIGGWDAYMEQIQETMRMAQQNQ